ncbi:MAG: hypothetical protein HC926_00520 [Synechococcaceae cyanobacterium SM2_3_60]|nr:hypothetical protein [Synechococcaceae cyanobacterium SM2_3_60]
MATDTSIEKRLAAVEAVLAELQKRIPNDGLQQVIGSFCDEPAFDAVLAYGRAIRAEQMPSQDPLSDS